MKVFLKTILTIVIASAFIFAFAGCAGGKDVKKEDKKEEKNVTKKDDKKVEENKNENGTGYPEWFLNQPKAEGVIYAVGVAKKQNPQLARDTAIARARSEIARVIQVKVSTMTKDFLEEAGAGDNAQSTEFTQIVSKQIADNVISGSQVEKVQVDTSTTPNTFYVLVRLDLKDMAGAIDQIIKSNAAAYSKLSANKAFEELSKELKDMKSSEIEQTKIISGD